MGNLNCDLCGGKKTITKKLEGLSLPIACPTCTTDTALKNFYQDKLIKISLTLKEIERRTQYFPIIKLLDKLTTAETDLQTFAAQDEINQFLAINE